MADMTHQIISSLKEEIEFASYQFFKIEILNWLFRNKCFVDEQNKIREFKRKDIEKIGAYTNLSNQIIMPIINQFFVDIQNLKKFFTSNPISWEYDKTKLAKKVRVYLHKLHRIAPVFSFVRAKKNLNILHLLLDQKNHWPHITTQIALVVFITDRNDKTNTEGKYIIQKNLRAFSYCSAYAFHRARNILRINTKGEIY